MLNHARSLLNRTLLSSFFTQATKYFCAQYTIDPYIKHYGELTLRQHRRLFLNKSVLNQNKDIMFADLRKPNDSMITLKQVGKCPGVIERFSGKIQEQIDVVLDGKKMKKMTKKYPFPLSCIYVRVQGKQYKCVYYNCQHHADGFIQKAYLKEYIPGQPNRLRVPLEITHATENPYLLQRGDIDIKLDHIDIICYNHEYPTRFYIDVSYLNPDRPYRIGDLANVLPPGIMIQPKYNLNSKIAYVQDQQFKTQDQKQTLINQAIERGKKGGKKAATTPGAPDASKDNKAAGGAGGSAAGGCAATKATTTASKSGGQQAGGKKK